MNFVQIYETRHKYYALAFDTSSHENNEFVYKYVEIVIFTFFTPACSANVLLYFFALSVSFFHKYSLKLFCLVLL